MIKVNSTKIPKLRFPNRETNLKDFSELLNPDCNIVEVIYEFDDDYISLMFIVREIQKHGYPVKIFVRYFAYGRMDRQVEDDLCTLEPICDFFGWLGVEEVIVVDPHSGKTMEYLEKAKVNARAVYPIRDWLPKIMKDFGFSKSDAIVLPDNGANSRYGDELRGHVNLCVLDKKRDPITRKITEIRLKEGTVVPNAKYIIVDDICAKGSTALETAEYFKSRGAGEFVLVVSHLERTALEGNVLSKRKSPFRKVYTSDSCMREPHPMVCYMDVDAKFYVNPAI